MKIYSQSRFKKFPPPAIPVNPKSTCTILPLKHLNIDVNGDIYPCCILNGGGFFKIGDIDELLTLEYDEVVNLFEERAKKLFSKYGDNELPCIPQTEIKNICMQCPLL